MSDIAEKLLKAIKSAEDGVPPLHLEGRFVGPRTDAERATLRRCVADREIVEACRAVLANNGDSGVWNGPELARFTLSRLARGYGLEETR